jgi:predicted MFS family arabinose efflux permease
VSDPIATDFQKIDPAPVDPSVDRGLSLVRLRGALPMLAIVLVGVAGTATSSLKPLIIQAFVHSVGLNKATSGFLLTTELISTSAGTIVATAFSLALRRRMYLFGALVLTMLANLASILFEGDAGIWLFGLRCVSGLGAGFALGRLAIFIALSVRPGRTTGLYMVSTLSFGAAAAFATPVVERLCGAASIFVLLAGTVPPALLLIRWLPEQHDQTLRSKVVSTRERRSLSLAEKLIIATSIAVFFFGMGTFWPFISVLGETAEIGSAQMSALLGWAAVAGALGAVTAVFTGDHRKSAVVVTLMFTVLCLSLALQLMFPRSLSLFVTSVLLFAYAYFSSCPMFMAMLSKLDTSGQMNGVYYFVSVAALALGPALAGWILMHQSDRFAGAACLRAVSLILFASAATVQAYYSFRARRLPD